LSIEDEPILYQLLQFGCLSDLFPFFKSSRGGEISSSYLMGERNPHAA
jgi:hypothetical protein